MFVGNNIYITFADVNNKHTIKYKIMKKVLFKLIHGRKCVKLYKELRRRQNAVLARHNELHPDRPGHGHEFDEYRATWQEVCKLNDMIYIVRLSYMTGAKLPNF